MDHRHSNQPILLVTATDLIGERIGARMRQELVLSALQELAPVEVAILTQDRSTPESGNPVTDGAPQRVARFGWHRQAPTRAMQVRRLALGGPPLEIPTRPDSRLHHSLTSWLHERYSCCWVSRTVVFAAVRDVLPDVPVVVDIDDLEAEKRRAQLTLRQRSSADRPLVTRARMSLAARQASRDIDAWRCFEQAVAGEADRSIVCSEDDARTLSVPGVEVIPNSYPMPPEPCGSREHAGPPTLLLVGPLTYGPNADAAEYLVREVLPRVRAEHPEARVRLVGRRSHRGDALHAPPTVTVTGFVPDIDVELARADVVVVPIRYGGGTRIKILEAFAHRIPVVSTAIGAHGLGAVHDEHLLLADEADDFAAACRRVIADRGLRRRLTAAAEAHYRSRFTADAVKRRVVEVVADILDASVTS